MSPTDLLPAEAIIANNSSFRDGLQFAWDSTSLGEAKTCLRKYHFTIRRGLVAKREALPLSWGIAFHKGREWYDKARAAGGDHDVAQLTMLKRIMQSTWDAVAQKPKFPTAAADPILGDNNRSRESLVRALLWHTENFRDDAVTTVILSNGKPAVELSFRFQVDDDLLLCGHIDRCVNYMDQIWVTDYKTTTTTIGSYFFDNFTPDNQMSLYALAARVVFNQPARGVMVDGIQSAVGFTRFARGFAHRSEEFLTEWLADTKFTIETVNRAAAANHFPGNDKACSMYGGCKFRSVCEKSPSLRESILKTEFTQRTWDPLIPR